MTLATTAEIAAELGIEPETVHKWSQRYSDFPEPVHRSQTYDVDAVRVWAKNRGLPKKGTR